MTQSADLSACLAEQGRVLLNGHRYEEAKRVIEQLTSAFPQNAEGWYLLSTVYGKFGKIAEAESFSRRAIALRPDYSDAYVNLGHSLMFQGKADEALSQYQTALRFNSESADAYLNIGNIMMGRGRHAEALENYLQALRIKPDFARAHNNLGTLYFEQGKIDEAHRSFDEALGLDAQTVYLNNLAKACHTAAQYNRYLKHYQNVVAAAPDPREARIGLIGIIDKLSQVTHEPWLEEELRACYEMDHIDAKALGKAAARILRGKHGGFPAAATDQDAVKWALEHIAADGLFAAYLEKSLNTDPDLELLLTKLRRGLLLGFQPGKAIGEHEAALLRALAYQGVNNEYVLAATAEEQDRLTELRDHIESDAGGLEYPGRDFEVMLSVFCMYDLLYSLECAARLGRVPRTSWTENFRGLVDRTLLNFLEEARIRDTIPSVGRLEDETSRSVRSQYEENPYPRWLSIPFTPKSDIRRTFKQLAPDFTPPPFLNGPLEILVAGCGTGKHPIQTALNYSNNIRITAVDISKSSLAYAARMARKLGVDNVQFIQGDILDLAKLDKQFHIVECIGVLHHMQDPMAGWRVLRDLLVDDGLMAIGLYSELARKSVVDVRDKIARSQLATGKDGIRDLRSEILNDPARQRDPYVRLINSYDFYSTSGCRDLLFHVMEHRFTLPALNAALTDLELRFLGFKFSKSEDVAIKAQFNTLFPTAGATADLLAWDQFEKFHPNTFANMYQFWCQKT